VFGYQAYGKSAVDAGLQEAVQYSWMNPLKLLLTIILLVAIFFAVYFLSNILYKHWKNKEILNKKTFSIQKKVSILVFGIIFFESAFINVFVPFEPAGDAAEIVNATKNLGSLLSNSYYGSFPEKSGLPILLHYFSFVAGPLWTIVLVNMICAGSIACWFCRTVWLLASGKISGKNLDQESSQKISDMSMIACFFLIITFLPIVYFTGDLYPIIPYLCCVVGAIYFQLDYFYNSKFKYLVFSTLLLTLGYIIKSNTIIFVLAIMLVWFFHFVSQVRDRQIKVSKVILTLVLMFFVIYIPGKGITTYVKVNNPYSVNPVHSTATFLAFGTSVPGITADNNDPGWSYDAAWNAEDKQTQQDLLNKNLDYFKNNVGQIPMFLLKKDISQWNNPTFGMNYVRQQVYDQSKTDSKIRNTVIAKESVWNGKISVAENYYLNSLRILLLLGIVLFGGSILLSKKRVTLTRLSSQIAALGGIAFFTFWEAKDQSIFPFFCCLIPCAIVGISKLYSLLDIKFKKNNLKIEKS
jgi:hypothetical protein